MYGRSDFVCQWISCIEKKGLAMRLVKKGGMDRNHAIVTAFADASA
jgi:hypothetical protein